jgi:phage shock protein A
VLNHSADRTDQMAARAAALEELEESGALDDVLAEGDEIDRELEKRSTEQRIERAEMRTRIGRETETEASVDLDGETTTS